MASHRFLGQMWSTHATCCDAMLVTKTNILSRMAASVAGTVVSLYFVLTQDLGHGPGHDEDHHAETHETHGKNEGQDDDSPDDDESKTAAAGMSQGGPKDSAKSKSKNAPKEEQDDAQADDPSQPGTGKPDKKMSADASKDDKKADEPGEASPDKSDKVGIATTYRAICSNCCSPTRAVSPRASTRPLASKRVSPTAIHTTARKSPSNPTRARRARALLRPRSSRARSPPSDLERRTRRSAAKPRLTRTRRAITVTVPSKHPVSRSILATNFHLAASCIVCELNLIHQLCKLCSTEARYHYCDAAIPSAVKLGTPVHTLSCRSLRPLY
jgi:hypothetical protein